MWVKLNKIFVLCLLLLPINISQVNCHIPDNLPTPSTKIDQYCSLSETCIHDTIAVCGKMGNEQRTFLDLCDLLEFACDTNQMYVHVDNVEGCPIIKPDKE